MEESKCATQGTALVGVDENIVNALDHFKSKYAESIGKIAVANGFACVTDGRIAIRVKLAGDVKDEIPQNFPADRLLWIVSSADSETRWRSLDAEVYDRMKSDFLESFREAERRERSNASDRYKRLECPSCGEDVWLDTYEDKLGKEDDLEKYEPMRFCDVHYPVRFNFGNAELDINFGYVVMVVLAFGQDVLVSCVKDGNGQEMLAFSSEKWNMKGVLMPMRKDGTYKGKVKMSEVANAADRTA